MFVTPLFLARCDSFLAYLRVKGKIDAYRLDSHEEDVAAYLHSQGKIRVRELEDVSVVNINAAPFNPSPVGEVEPLVWHMAVNFPTFLADDNNMDIYRKNWPQSRPLTAEFVDDTIEE